MGKIHNHTSNKCWVKKYAKMSLERVIKVKKGEITSGRGTSICKCLAAQAIWQEMKLSQRQGQPPKGLVSHSKKLGPSPVGNLLTFSREETTERI